jgi:hypothetical protein
MFDVYMDLEPSPPNKNSTETTFCLTSLEVLHSRGYEGRIAEQLGAMLEFNLILQRDSGDREREDGNTVEPVSVLFRSRPNPLQIVVLKPDASELSG